MAQRVAAMNRDSLFNTSILVVDDEDGILQSYRNALSPRTTPEREIDNLVTRRQRRIPGRRAKTSKTRQVLSYNLLTASSGEEAVEIVRRERQESRQVPVGFFDMVMPGGIDGVETIRRILEIDSQMLCAVVTAYTDHSPNRLGTLFSRQDDWLYFNKPFSQGTLEQTAYHLVTAWNQRRREESLIRNLERLHEQNSEHTRNLAYRGEELLRQKNLVTDILDMAQIIVLTQNDRGEITMVNKYTQSLTGYKEKELLGKPFVHLIPLDSATMDHFDEVHAVLSGASDHFHDQTEVECRDGERRQVAWHHSRLSNGAGSGAVAISAGLDITDRHQALIRLAWLAEHDSLTGLSNRTRIQRELDEAILSAKQLKQQGALLLIDIDHFKDVNDSRGQLHGDTLLQAVSETLSSTLRRKDTVGRIGGDEFAVVLRRASNQGAAQTAQKLMTAIGMGISPDSETRHTISASVGIVMFPKSGTKSSELLTNADLAVNKAKKKSGSRYHLFTDEDEVQARQEMQERVFWRARIEQALAENDFVLYYQPIMDVGDGTVSHYEALVRLREEDGRIVGPSVFIEIAESEGLIREIDKAIVRKAVSQIGTLLTQGQPVHISVNLSPHAIADDELISELEAILSEHEVNPANLILEITERVAIADFVATRDYMTAIKAMGCRFAIDDFGVGFGSFNYLKQLPADYLKIDGAFIRELATNKDDQILVEALARVARGFGKKTVAEYVETDTVLALLREYRVDYAQGHLVGEPLPADQVFGEREKTKMKSRSRVR